MALNLQNAKEKFINALFGVPAEIEQAEGNVQYQYPTQRQADFMQGLPNNKDLLGKIQASPYNQGYTDEEIINRVAQGQNFGLGELANEQKEWGIKLPRANNQLDEEAVRGNYLNVYQPKLQTGATTTPRQGGFFNDLAQGYQENATQGFNVQNLAPDQNKGLATRIGEGLGTLTRFANSPLGRGLIAYGTTRALGYDDPVEQGLIAGVTRQGNISRDKAYRQGLINMGVDEAQVNAIPGIVSNDIFANFARAKQLQDNAEYRNMMLQNQQAQNELMNQFRQDQAEYQRMKDIQEKADRDRDYGFKVSEANRDYALELAKLNKENTPQLSQKNRAALLSNQNAIQQIDKAIELIKKNPKATGFLVGSMAGSDKAYLNNYANDKSTPEEIATRAAIADLSSTIIHDRSGAATTLFEMERLKPFLASITDNPETAIAKLEQLKKKAQDESNLMAKTFGTDYNFGTSNEIINNNSNQTVRVKTPDGKIGTIPVQNLEAALKKGYTRL